MAKDKEKTEAPADVQEPKKEEPAFLAQYRKCYPSNKKFHVTSDKLVFLESEFKKAAAHQATLGSGELITY